MAVPMPPVLVMIVCKVILGAPDDNSQFTHWRPSTWDLADGIMHCRRQEVQLVDPDVDKGADPTPFTSQACMSASVRMAADFDIAHMDRPWRFWRAACPTPIIDGQSGDIVGWKLPECGTYGGTVDCISDTEI
jgi:hypothetical protein